MSDASEPIRWEKIVNAAIDIVAGSKVFTFLTLIIWLQGTILSYILFGTNSKFENKDSLLNKKYFHFGIGVISTLIIMSGYSLCVNQCLPTSIEEFSTISLPSALISSSLTFIAIVVYQIKGN